MNDIRQAIVQKFLAANLQVHPEVVIHLQKCDDPALIDKVIANVPPNAFVAVPSHIPGRKIRGFEPPLPAPVQVEEETTAPEKEEKGETDGERFLQGPGVDIVYGQANQAHAGVDFSDFVHYFRNRYDRLGAMLRPRGDAMPISGLTQTTRYRQTDVTITGMIVEVRNTAKGNRIAVLEDPTDIINVLFNNQREVFSEAERLIPDEVVMVKGRLSNDGSMLFADSLMRPDIPVSHAPFRSKTPGKAIMISDVHVGSDTFLEEAWQRFVDWVPKSGAQYLLIAGDLVDGIGIYPDQDKELTIPNIFRQYERFSELIAGLPTDIEIVIAPGNHDAVRGSEPQPALPDMFTSTFPPSVTLVENPCMVNLQGVNVLMYHGRSYDDMISMIPGASYDRAEEMMKEMLVRRHIACTYGERTPILAAKEDALIIDPIPEIFLTGHVHIAGITSYRGVLCINAGTWQSQTGFQKQMNIQPTPALAVLVDLQTLKPEFWDFSAPGAPVRRDTMKPHPAGWVDPAEIQH